MKIPALIAAACTFTLAPLSGQAQTNPSDWFSDGDASWVMKSAPDVTVSKTVAHEDGQDALVVEVGNVAEGAPADVRVFRAFGSLNAESSNRLSFQARAEEPGRLTVFIAPQNEPHRVLFRKEIALTQDWSDQSFTFLVKEGANDCVLGFAGLARTNNKFQFRAITLEN